MKKILAIIFLVLFVLNHVSSQNITTDMLSSLDKAETDMFDANAHGDSAAFRKLSSKEFVSINADGTKQNLDECVMNTLKFKGSTYSRQHQEQKIYGNVALRNGKATFYFGGHPVAEVLYTTGWVYQDNQWKYIYWQGTLTGMSLPRSSSGSPK